MEKPVLVRWINVLLILRLAIIVISLTTVGIAVFTFQRPGFITGFADGVFSRINLESPYLNPVHTMAYLTGFFGVSLLLIFLQYTFLNNLKKVGFWICFVSDFLITLGNGGVPLLNFIVLILALNWMISSHRRGAS